MRNIILATTLLALLNAATLQAQTAKCYPEGKTAADVIRENPLMAGNNHLAYTVTDLTDTKAPRGFKPFYISHYGRHGSRSDYKGESWVRLAHILSEADSLGILNEKGMKAYEAACQMCRESEGMREMLTPVGVKEHALIASRMYKRFPKVFKGKKSIEARSSTVQRCIVSMGSFTTALAARNPKLDIDILTGARYMDYIGRTTGYREATKGAEEMLSRYKKSMPRDTTTFFSIMFNDAAAGRELIKDAYHFEGDLLNAGTYCSCFGVEESFFDCMPEDVVYSYWSVKNHALYLEHCNSIEFGDRRMPIARMLVRDILSKADAAVAGNGRAADLRFGHDYPLLALAGYLDIEGVGERYSFDEIDSNWFGSKYICMASNLQLVFYKNRKGEVLVKCLWNEREMGITALKPVYGPYYKWSDVREYWSTRYPIDLYPEPDGRNETAAPGMPKN